MPGINDLALQFSITLQHYLANPTSIICQSELTTASYLLLCEAIKSSTLEPDQYIALLKESLAPHLEEMRLSEKLGLQLDKFNRELSQSDDGTVRQTFHALNIAYQHLKENSESTSGEVLRNQLFYAGAIPEIDEDEEVLISQFMMM